MASCIKLSFLRKQESYVNLFALSFLRRQETSLFFKNLIYLFPPATQNGIGQRPMTPLSATQNYHSSFLRNRGPQTPKAVGLVQESSLANVVILPSGRYLKSAALLNTCINAELQHLLELRLQEI
ncbi:MAG: hypothetical protein R6V77_06950 [Candidatus Cloacimonadaceae bacterium]